jgi:hypothetical protein
MTAWPEPERERPILRPPREPGAPRRRLTDDERWVWAGLILALGLVVGYFGYWTDWFGLTAPDRPTSIDQAPLPGDGVPAGRTVVDHSVVGKLILLVLLALVVAGLIAWIVWGRRDRPVPLSDLSAEEQQRRRRVGELLRHVEPPVSAEEARRQLRPPWFGGPGDPGDPGPPGESGS